MGSDRCGECGDEFVWDRDAGSAVCLACGTLQDSSQVVLDTHITPEDNTKHGREPFTYYQRYTLKGLHNNWFLPGQGTQATNERNKIAMREYTIALARRIGHPSLSSRALFLFELAMERGHFRYGKTARLVVGASMAIALRENKKGETIKDIAFLLNESHVALARVFTMVVSLLEVKLVSVEPSWHLSALRSHLEGTLSQCPLLLPKKLNSILRDIHYPTVLRAAASLSELVSRAGIMANLTSPATACAIFILAIEGEILRPLPNSGELAKALGRRYGIGMDVIMRRYKTVREHAEGWAADVPWAEDVGRSAVTKTAKRVDIARCLKDALYFQENRWRAKFEAAGPLSTPNDDVESVSSSEISSSCEVDLQQNDEVSLSQSSRPRKRRKVGHNDDVSHFLLSPSCRDSSRKPRTDLLPPLDAASHMLTSDAPTFNHAPSRLQLLATAKPVDEITDEELFAEGELDSFLRNSEEREVLIQTCDWAREKDNDGESDTAEANVTRAWTSRRELGDASRMNIEAFNHLLDEQDLVNWARVMDKNDDDDDSWTRQIMTQAESFERSLCKPSLGAGGTLHSATTEDNDSEVVGPWRPLSPDGG